MADTTPGIVGEALFYPNPWRQDEGAELGYKLTGAMDIELQIYDMRGNLIHKGFANAGDWGGQATYQRVATHSSKGVTALGLDSMRRLPSGVYFYLLLNKGTVLTKDKFVIIP